MADANQHSFSSRDRGHWVRLRTLIALRWIAVSGQIIAFLVAWRAFGLEMDYWPAILAIGSWALANLIAMFVYPESKRLSETEATTTQLIDTAQLAFLLYLTGGLNNPFAVLLIVPVTISATALERRSTIILGVVAAALATLLCFVYRPLVIATGPLELPELYLLGYWVAILTALIFLAAYTRRVSDETFIMADALSATQMALAREQKLTDLGGVVAAAAHELGTPLATIKLVSSELAEELKDKPDLAEDVKLISQQADRCKEILQSMGRAGKDDPHMHVAPLATVVYDAAGPHLSRSKEIHFEIRAQGDIHEREPQIRRRPELIHGIRNLVQNAIDFAAAQVWVDVEWSNSQILVRITDDGPGYPPQFIRRIGDPFVSSRAAEKANKARPEYEGMGLGLFIAKTLLERTGAILTFKNASDPFLAAEERPEKCGAVVEVIWPASEIVVSEKQARRSLGENQPIQV